MAPLLLFSPCYTGERYSVVGKGSNNFEASPGAFDASQPMLLSYLLQCVNGEISEKGIATGVDCQTEGSTGIEGTDRFSLFLSVEVEGVGICMDHNVDGH